MAVLDGMSLTIDAVAAVADGQDQVVLALAARDRMAASREVVEEALRLDLPVYGLTTAVAERRIVRLDAAQARASAGS
jgi:histidine ammonia-lyase